MKLETRKIDLFRGLLSNVQSNLLELGQLFVTIVDDNDNGYEMILKEVPGITFAFLESLERIGRGKLLPQLLLDPSPAADRAVSQGLNVADQKRMVRDEIAVVEMTNNGGTKVEKRKYQDLNIRQAARVICDGKIQTPEEQTKKIEAELERHRQALLRYQIVGEKVFIRDVRHPWTYAELSAIVEQIKPKAEQLEAAMKTKQIVKWAIGPERTTIVERAMIVERTNGEERASAVEGTSAEERATRPERTSNHERATLTERTKKQERTWYDVWLSRQLKRQRKQFRTLRQIMLLQKATQAERTTVPERARVEERTRLPERANRTESTTGSERAKRRERTNTRERVSMKDWTKPVER